MKVKHIQSFNEHQLFPHSVSKKIESIKVKHLIEYLNTLNPEAEVSLDKDDWDYDVDAITTIKKNGLFNYEKDFDEDGDILFINN